MTVILLGMAFFAVVGITIFGVAWKATKGMNTSGYQGLSAYGAGAQQLSDKHDLHKLGYAQLLHRRWTSSVLLSLSIKGFSLIGMILLLYVPAVQLGGLSVIGIGLPIAALFSLLVAASLAEFASAVPVSGGAGSWATLLGGRKWGVRAGWLGAGGQASLLALWNMGCAAVLNEWASVKLGFSLSLVSFWLIVIAVSFTQAAVHTWWSGFYDQLLKLSLWLQILLVIGIMLGLVWLLWPAAYPPELLYHFYNAELSGSVTMGAFIGGSLIISMLFSSAGSSAHTAEETIEPRVRVPWAMFQGGAYVALMSILLLTIIALYYGVTGNGASSAPVAGSIRDESSSMGAGWLMNGLSALVQNETLSSSILLLCAVCLGLCGLKALTVFSRSLFSLARARVIPGDSYWSAVSFQSQTPIRVVWLAATCALVLLIVVSLVDIQRSLMLLVALNIVLPHASFAIPIGLKLIHSNHGKEWKSAPWSLGSWSRPIHAAAFGWLLLSAIMAALLIHHLAIAAAAVMMLAATAINTRRGND